MKVVDFLKKIENTKYISYNLLIKILLYYGGILMFIEEVKEKYNKGEYELKYINKKKISEKNIMNPSINPLYDETISILELKERVKKYNEEIDLEIETIEKENRKKEELFLEDILNAIMEENYAFNKEQAKIIYEYIYREHHSSMSDFFIYLEEFVDIISNIIKAK